ncbi:MAG: DNA primase [Lachnospiraceae bacterium]|nr:DNA primase [Lachnospiraceae bacterium]
MPYYSDETIEQVRQSTDIVQLISGFVNLKRKGSNYFGLCPFHNEKTSSFSVSENKQMYYCFGCHATGNVYTFLMKHENMSFMEAVQYLAEKAGIKLPQADESEEAKRIRGRRERLYLVNTEAAKYFYKALRSPQGELGLKYFKGRELSEETMQKFGLGYSLQYSDDMTKYLQKKGFTIEELTAAGVSSYDERYGARDKFYNRVMFPIMNGSGKVIGFGGRVMGEGEPKYLNTSETEIFEKRKNLFGLNLARSSRARNFILCEGYMDVISLHQAGFDQAMASLGTAFTSDQAMILKRFGREVLLAYDSDGAGVNAALRALSILRACGMSGRVINMQPYKDPDEFIKNLGAEEYEERLKKAENGFMFEVRILRKDYDFSDPASKTAFYNEVAKKLCVFEEEMERENYIEAVSEEYGIPKEALKKQVISLVLKGGVKLPETGAENAAGRHTAQPRSEDNDKYAQRVLLTWLSEEPQKYKGISEFISADDFTDPIYHKVAVRMLHDMEEGQPNPAAIINMFEDADEQQQAGQVFHTKLDAIVTDEEKEKAFRDIVLKVKQERFDHDNKAAEGGLSLEEKLAQKRLMEDLRRRIRP